MSLPNVFRVKEASSYIYFAVEDIYFFLSGCSAINLPGFDRTPKHVFDYMDVIRASNWRTLSETKSQ